MAPSNSSDTDAADARLASLIATSVAEAIRSTQPSIDSTKVEIAVVGETADPEIESKVFCRGCRTGNPPFHSDEAVEKSAELLAAGDQVEATKVIGPMAGIRRRITFDQAAVREQLSNGFVYTQCKSCGRPLDYVR